MCFLVKWFCDHAPSQSTGSRDIVEAWMARKGMTCGPRPEPAADVAEAA